MSAINAALDQIDRAADEGDLAAPRRDNGLLELEALGEPILLPDGKRIYPPRLHGQPIDELACALLDMDNPAESTFLRLTGPPGVGKSQLARCIAYRLWQARGREVECRCGVPFYGFVEMSGGPPATSTCSATSSCPPPTTSARCGWSTRRSCRRCARGGW
jgi:hypothetical protein